MKIHLMLLVLSLSAGQVWGQSVSSSPATTPTTDETSDADIAREFDIRRAVESDELTIRHDDEAAIEREMQAFDAAELSAGDKETFEKFFDGVGMQTPEMLDRAQLSYALVLNEIFCRAGQNKLFGDDNDATFYYCCLYTFLCAEFQGVDFSEVPAMLRRPWPGRREEPRLGFVDSGSDRTNQNFQTLMRYRGILEMVRTNLGRFALMRNNPAQAANYFRRELAEQLDRWKNERGMLVSDVLFVWLLGRKSEYFRVPRIPGLAEEQRNPYDPQVAVGIFESKTTPNLAFNNRVAELISRRLSWDEVRRETGMPLTRGLTDWLAGVIWEHGETIRMIPLVGSLLSAAEAACDAFDSRASGTARAGAVGRFFFHFTMAVTDVFLVKAAAVAAGRAALNVGRLAVNGARSAGTALRTFATEVQAQLRLFRFNAASARTLREAIRVQLKWLRNRLLGAPRAIADVARRRALEYAEEMARLQSRVRPSKVTAAVNRRTGEVVLGRSSRGIGREGVAVHARMERIEAQVMQATQGAGLEAHPFRGCSEWDAVNQALNRGWDIEDLVLRTVFTKRSAFGTFAEPCRNCQVTVFGAVLVY